MKSLNKVLSNFQGSFHVHLDRPLYYLIEWAIQCFSFNGMRMLLHPHPKGFQFSASRYESNSAIHVGRNAII